MKTIEIKNPIKPWWPGDKRVEKYMSPIKDAIDKHMSWQNPGSTEIYNRAYEAVYKAIKDQDDLRSLTKG